jgi:hypothetical protein
VRLLTGVFGAAAALLIWVIAVPVFDVEHATNNRRGQPMELAAPIIVMSIIPASWLGTIALERFTPAGPAIWTILAIAVLRISLVPLSHAGAAASAWTDASRRRRRDHPRPSTSKVATA